MSYFSREENESQAHIFPCLPFVIYLLTEILLFAFDVPCQIHVLSWNSKYSVFTNLSFFTDSLQHFALLGTFDLPLVFVSCFEGSCMHILRKLWKLCSYISSNISLHIRNMNSHSPPDSRCKWWFRVNKPSLMVWKPAPKHILHSKTRLCISWPIHMAELSHRLYSYPYC